MSDLVKRLRGEIEDHMLYRGKTIHEEAADRIEAQDKRNKELEAALRNIAADCEADYPPSHGAIKYAARAALAGEKKDE